METMKLHISLSPLLFNSSNKTVKDKPTAFWYFQKLDYEECPLTETITFFNVRSLDFATFKYLSRWIVQTSTTKKKKQIIVCMFLDDRIIGY